MKTPETPRNLAIHALANSIAATVEVMKANADQAQDAANMGDLNGAVGALMFVESKVAALSAQLTAVLELHKAGR